jgi:hypothetical protein
MIVSSRRMVWKREAVNGATADNVCLPVGAPNEVSMRNFKSTCPAAIAVVLAAMPHFVKADPCASDIAEWEATIQQLGVEALAGQ